LVALALLALKLLIGPDYPPRPSAGWLVLHLAALVFPLFRAGRHFAKAEAVFKSGDASVQTTSGARLERGTRDQVAILPLT
jgi:hypothetical protein